MAFERRSAFSPDATAGLYVLLDASLCCSSILRLMYHPLRMTTLGEGQPSTVEQPPTLIGPTLSMYSPRYLKTSTKFLFQALLR